eukprot:CAMPEP_0171186084 /NCGR_PEP_ID=MMETSP0790-20130122/16629_1 /TAXON_ID=2925 /ORGANISM="Alexandrium catenella, Strain OF101" /LENGTH=212 /DNA_ID=CAMNT_0011651115 /DNA_START=309 /DNA_END=948 /DNA_ORIENTATION=+
MQLECNPHGIPMRCMSACMSACMATPTASLPRGMQIKRVRHPPTPRQGRGKANLGSVLRTAVVRAGIVDVIRDAHRMREDAGREPARAVATAIPATRGVVLLWLALALALLVGAEVMSAIAITAASAKTTLVQWHVLEPLAPLFCMAALLALRHDDLRVIKFGFRAMRHFVSAVGLFTSDPPGTMEGMPVQLDLTCRSSPPCTGVSTQNPCV